VIRRPGRLATSLVAATAASLVFAASAGAASGPEQLVAAYAPALMLREQKDALCDTTVEQYKPPTTVNVVLGNPTVTLGHYVNGREVPVKTAPTAADIAGLGDDYYLDLRGDPLGDTCVYAKDYAKLKAGGRAPPITYAHIATQPGHPGLVVQYFFFYYFNQFNDLHEGDWEGMQIAFRANTPAGALAQGPSQIALFQHAGGERANWRDRKVQKDGTHPIVYPAAGSHATFYDNAIYIENGNKGSGVGCDNTSEPLIRSDPRPILVPTRAGPGSRYQWLSYLGHWGQREKGFNIGPQGPVTKRQWLEPFTWMSGIRQTSPRLPGGTILGPAASSAFCGAIEGISGFINLEAKTTLGAIGLGVFLLLLLAVPPFLTRWRPVDLTNLRHRWAVGQLLRGARQFYGRYWRAMLAIAGIGFVILGALQGLQYLFAEVHGSQDFTLSVTPGNLNLRWAGSVGGIAHPIGSAVVSGAVVALMRLHVDGEDPSLGNSFRAMYERLWRVVAGQLLGALLVVLLMFTVIGIPYAIYKYVGWQFIQQEILFRNCSIREAFHGSARLVKGRWWRTTRVVVLLFLLSVITGPVLGFFLIFANFSALLVNLIGSVIFALLIPYVTIGRTLLYFDLGVSEEEEEAAAVESGDEPKRRRRLRLRRARPATETG
jgi:hypothetical protein